MSPGRFRHTPEDTQYHMQNRSNGRNSDWPLCTETPPSHISVRPPRSGRTSTTGDTAQAEIRGTEDYSALPIHLQHSYIGAPYAPSPPVRTPATTSEGSSAAEFYGPDRLFGRALATRTRFPVERDGFIGPQNFQMGGSTTGHGFSAGPSIPMAALLANPGQQYKDAFAREASNVTPGVDDSPYILYALDALTGDIDTTSGPPGGGNSDHNSFPFRHVPDDGLGYYRPRSISKGQRDSGNIGTSAIKMPTAPTPIQQGFERRYSARRNSGYDTSSYQATPRVSESAAPGDPRTSTTSTHSTLVYNGNVPPRSSVPSNHLKDAWSYLDLKTFSPQAQLVFPPPTFKPLIMRPLGLAILGISCILMIAGLSFSAVFSKAHHGLVGYSGSMYGGQFFVFRVLPQVLSVGVVLYTQALSNALLRILPFSRMQALGHPHPEDRNGAIFDNLYPVSFLWPQISSAMPWRVRIPIVVFWLANFLVPIQSTLFTVVKFEGLWRWAISQGVAWTLVGCYAVLVATTLFVLVDWHNRSTGLIWDPRSIADLITLATNSNTMADYNGTELLGSRKELRAALQNRTIDKLGYWTWRDGRTSGMWHGIGTDSLDDAWFHRTNSDLEAERTRRGSGRVPRPWNEKVRSVDCAGGTEIDVEALGLSPHNDSVRYRHIPWLLRSASLAAFISVSFLLLLALFVVSFLPGTSVRAGFLPRLPAGSSPSGFSSANFLFSFLPAFVGQILHLLFASMDMTLRVLQPWAELSSNAGGSQPATSILADYAACLPLQVTWHALANRHWRVAAVSLVTTVSAFLPALAGGLFMALTVSSGEVRMVPNMALYAVFLTVLVVMFSCLVSMLPGRRYLRLPHGVTCIAEILSFCASDDLLQEPAFKNAHSRSTLMDQLGINSLPVSRSRWIFSTGTSGDDRRLGIRRVKRYTELTNRPSGRRAPRAGGR